MHLNRGWFSKSPAARRYTRRAMGTFIGTSLWLGLGGGAVAEGASDGAMQYFRVATAAECNVYMNYSFWSPHFTLEVRHPDRLSEEQRRFVADFNAAAARRIEPALASACRTPASAMFLSDARKRELYDACVRKEGELGTAEAGWPSSRLAAPSNCISSRLAHSGVVNLIAAPLKTIPMSIDSWTRLAVPGR